MARRFPIGGSQSASRRRGPSPSWRLSDRLERSIAELVGAGCDADQLRARVHVGAQLPADVPRGQVRALVEQIRALVQQLERLAPSFTIVSISPPIGSEPSRLARLTADLTSLGDSLKGWLGDTSRRDLAEDVCRAAVIGYVLATTRKPHDREVADLLGFASAEAARRFRERHSRLVQNFRLVSSASDEAPPPPPPSAKPRR